MIATHPLGFGCDRDARGYAAEFRGAQTMASAAVGLASGAALVPVLALVGIPFSLVAENRRGEASAHL